MGKTSLFIDPSSEINVKFWIGVQDGQIVGAIDEESKFEDVEYDEYEASFREPNYRDIADLSDGAVAINSDGNYALSVNQVRLNRVVRLLKSWSLTDDKGKAVPVNEDNIEKLNPAVAFTLSAALEAALGIVPSDDDPLPEPLVEAVAEDSNES